MPINRYENRILWVDIETTGTDLVQDSILEIVLVVTNLDLEILYYDETFFPFNLETSLLSPHIDQFVINMHRDNGLWEDCKRTWEDYIRLSYSAKTIYIKALQENIKNVIVENAYGSLMAGNTVHFDRSFLNRDFNYWFNPPNVHYRILDISSIKELFNRWIPLKRDRPSDTKLHRGFSDIKDSIAEFKFYLEEFGYSPGDYPKG